MPKFTYAVLTGLLFTVANTAWAAEIDFGSRDRLVYHYIMDGESVISANAPDWLTTCKTKSVTPDELGFSLPFQQDLFNGQIQISNPSRQNVAQMKIEFKKRRSSILQSNKRVASIKPNSSVVLDSWMDLRLHKIDTVVSIRGFAPTVIDCTEKFSAKEIKEREEKRLVKEAERKAAAQKRREIELKREIIFDNCMADKLPVTNNRQLNKTVRKICNRIAGEPNWWQRLLYSD